MKQKEGDKKRIIYLIVFISISLLLILILAVWFTYLFLPSYEKSQIKNNTVVNVIDGDTFEYYNADTGNIKIVRLLCVNTPEENEQGYEEAKTFLEELILGNQVILEKDISETDKYGRLLRYAYLENENGTEIFVNELIVKNGYGEILRIEPDVKRCGEM